MAEPRVRARIPAIALAVVALLLIAAIAVISVVGGGAAGPGRSAAATPVPDATLKQECIDGAAVGSGNDGLAADCALLLEAKDPLRGTETLNWSADTAIASWEGITVSGSPSRVTQLDIDGWNSERRIGREILLSGTIPAALGGLSKLQRLTLSRNALTGTIPVELAHMSELTSLQLYSNQLTGGIPPELGRLANLAWGFDLSRNQLSGSIPVELGKLSNLRTVRLQNNRLTGSIPASLGDLSNLNQLNLAGNMLSGCIPAALRGITLNDLSSLSLDYCTTTTTYALTTSAGANGGVSPLPGTYSYLSGSSVTVTATPGDGYRVASWGGDCSGTATTCTLTMDADKTASVTFGAAVLYTLTTSAGANGSIEPAPGAHSRWGGERVTVTATADSGYRVASWGGDCSGTATTCDLTIDGNKTASVTFELDQYTLTTSVGANGSIDPAARTHTYSTGTSVTVTATPDSRYRIASWGGDCAATPASDTTCELTMDANKTASATFEEDNYTLTTSTGANGSINPAAGTHTYNSGASVTITATADSGHQVDEWGGDCSGSGTTCELTMDGDKTASVTFEVTRTLTTSTGANGGIDPASGTHTYTSGVSVTVTATPDSGYRVDAWGGDCSGSAPTCVLILDAGKTASVTFERDEYTLTTAAGANGSVSPAAGAHTYDARTSVTVTATPGTDHRVASWGGDCSGAALTCELTMDADKTASVTFERGVTYTLTASATGGGSVSPDGVTAHRPNAAVVLTATWLEWTHTFTGWGGDCSGTAATCTLTMNANKTATATFKALPRLTVFTSGSADGEVILEWTAGAEVATRWQYRQRGPVWQGVQYRLSGTELVEVEGEVWGAWQDVPSSAATTSSYRLSGLRGGFGYDFQVRPWTASGAGDFTATFVNAAASERGSDGIAYAYPATFLESGQQFRVHYTAYTFTVPAGMDLVMGRGTLNSDGSRTVSLWDAQSRSFVLVDVDTGADVGRNVLEVGGSAGGRDGVARSSGGGSGRDVGGLFDEIITSMTRAPLP